MAFGDYATLQDAFTRADVNPLDGSWSNQIVVANSAMQIISNTAAGISGTSSAWYTGFVPTANCEAYITITVAPANATFSRVYARVATPGTAGVDGYFAQWTKGAATDTLSLQRLDNASATQVGSSVGLEYTDGDKLGIQCVGSQIAVYTFQSGVWTQQISETDGTYSAAGFGGIGTSGVQGRFDDFFMGSITAPDDVFPVPHVFGHGVW